MRIGQTSAVHLASQAVSTVVGFLATLLIARELGAGVLGTYSLVIAVVIWLQVFGDVGLRKALEKRLSEPGPDDPYLAAGAAVQLGVFALLAALVLALGGAASRLADVPMARVLGPFGPAVAALGFVSILFAFLLATLRGQHRVHVAALLDPTERTVRSALQIGAVLAGLGLVGLLAGYAVAGLAASALAIVFVAGRPERPRRKYVGDLLSYSRYSWLGGLTDRAFKSMDTVVLGLFVASSRIGIYEVAWNVASILAVFGVSISQALFPEMSRLSSAESSAKVAGLIEDALAYTGLFVVPGLVGAVLVGDRVLAIYGSEFAQGYFVLIVLVVARLLYAYGSQFVNTLNAIDRPDAAFRVNGAFALTNVVFNIVLVARYGWIGAAVATAVSALVTLVLGYRMLSAVVDVTVPGGEIAKQWLAAGAMGLVVYAGRAILSGSLPVTLVLVAVGALIYFAVLSTLSQRFRATIGRNLPAVR